MDGVHRTRVAHFQSERYRRSPSAFFTPNASPAPRATASAVVSERQKLAGRLCATSGARATKIDLPCRDCMATLPQDLTASWNVASGHHYDDLQTLVKRQFVD